MSSKHKGGAVTLVRGRVRDLPGDATRAALIDAAETMFADKGVDAVSLRQIGISAGSANANVVGYHFGTKAALVKATLLRNRPRIEMRRAELLDQAKREGREHDLSALIQALCRPLFELRNANGRHTYALFLWHIARSDWWERLSYVASFPATQELMRRLTGTLPGLPATLFMERMRAVGDLVSGVLQRLDSRREDDRTEELLLGHALQMAHAVLHAPYETLGSTAGRRTSSMSGIREVGPIFG